MTLPFSQQEFLDVFAAYNQTWWPAVLLSWVLAVVMLFAMVRGVGRPLTTFLFVAGLWAWSGAVYHAVFFTAVNPAASIFAVLFVLEAAGLTWLVLKEPSTRFDLGPAVRGKIAAAFLIYSVLYPILVWLGGDEFPRAPAFAVPCPTVLFTTGVLLAVRPPIARWLYVIPILWSIIAGSAAILFDLTPDLMLFAGATALVIDVLGTNRVHAPTAA